MYRVYINPKENTKYNPIHDEFDGQSAKILSVQEGYSGVFKAVSKEDGEWSNFHTSPIEKIEYLADDCIRVTTMNTVYLFVEEF